MELENRHLRAEVLRLQAELAAEKESTKRVLNLLDDVYKQEFALVQEVEELKDDIERYKLRESLREQLRG